MCILLFAAKKQGLSSSDWISWSTVTLWSKKNSAGLCFISSQIKTSSLIYCHLFPGRECVYIYIYIYIYILSEMCHVIPTSRYVVATYSKLSAVGRKNIVAVRSFKSLCILRIFISQNFKKEPKLQYFFLQRLCSFSLKMTPHSRAR